MSARFADLDFEGFKALARDPSLSPNEKVGFPDSYRAGKEKLILRDIAGKLTGLAQKGKAVLDIGPGCGGVATALIDLCRRRGHRLTLIDSAEMLALLPDAPSVSKIAGRFPDDCRDFLAAYRGRFDAILVYSVLQYVFAESNVFAFLDRSLELLADGGRLLIGDIPNQSMRKRFFSSESGIRFHQRFTGTDERPSIEHNVLEPGRIDDAVVLSLVQRARAAGFHAYLVPQAPALPMTNRREDILIVKP
jgi:2-polyprenyl-3-methyl-5-hydroxy-6-metoxy-1,4-benzoquinol methylase